MRTAADEAEALRLATARRSAFAALARMRPTTILEDVTVPRSELAGMVAFVAEVALKYNLTVGTFGHMGDGNIHYNVLVTPEHGTEAVNRLVHGAVEQFGGSISAEHGIGQYRVAELARVVVDTRGVVRPAARGGARVVGLSGAARGPERVRVPVLVG